MHAFAKLGRTLALVTALIVPSTACFQMEYAINLEEDLSGEADFDIAVDLDKMAYAMASAQKAFMGDGGSPTDEEVAQAREELLSQVDSGVLEEDNLRGEIEPELPPGVTLVSADQSRDGLRTEMSLRLAFDDIRSLNDVDVGPDGGSSGAEPFGGLEIVDEGDTFVIRNEPMNPMEEIEEETGLPDGMKGLVQTMFNELSIAFTIAAPFEIVEHNATSQDGNRLRWVYDYESMASGVEHQIFVRYRR